LFLAQPLEPRPQRVVLEMPWRAGMKILQRRRIGLLARDAQTLGLVRSDPGLDVHRHHPGLGNVLDYNLSTCLPQSRSPALAVPRSGGEGGRQGLLTLRKSSINTVRSAA